MSAVVQPRIEMRPPGALRPYPNNARRHSKAQIRQVARSIERFGFTNPVLIASDGEIVAGHGRVAAAQQLGLPEVPVIALAHLTAEERRAYVLADNKLALNAGWDQDLLAIELQGLIEIDFDLDLTGFALAEVDLVLDGASERETRPAKLAAEDAVPAMPDIAITRRGDLWQLGEHRLVCGDARDAADYDLLLGQETADLVFTDPPYNVPIQGHVSGMGAVTHREFAMASGEMSPVEFAGFLTTTPGQMAGRCRDGAITFVCMPAGLTASALAQGLPLGWADQRRWILGLSPIS